MRTLPCESISIITEEKNLSFHALSRVFTQNGMELKEIHEVSLEIKNSQDKFTNLRFIFSD